MIYYLHITLRAVDDANAAIEYYNFHTMGLGELFEMEMQRLISAIQTNPYTFSVRHHDVRLAIFRKFPYSIHYSIDGNKIMIEAVLSDYQNHQE